MLKRLSAAAVVLAVATPAVANDAAMYLEQSLFKYKKVTDKVGDADAVETTSMENMPNSLEFGITLNDKINFYLYPTMPGTTITVGYLVMPNLEINATLGMTSEKVGDADPETNNTYGLGAMYVAELPFGGLELAANYAMNSGKSTETANNVELEVETSGSAYILDASAVIPLAKNLSYVAGITYTGTASTSTVDSTDTETTGSTIDCNLFGLRASL